MKNYIDQMIVRRESLMKDIKFYQEDAVYADGLAYSEITLKISRAHEEIRNINREIHRYTFVGPEFPEWVRNQRHREHVEVERKGRVQSAMKKIEQLFGGKSGNTNY